MAQIIFSCHPFGTTEIYGHKASQHLLFNLNVFLFSLINIYNNMIRLGTSLFSPHLGVNSLNILPLGQGTLVTTKTPFGIFVNSFIGGASSGFDHIENSAFVRGEAGDFAGDFSAKGGAFAKSLLFNVVVGGGQKTFVRELMLGIFVFIQYFVSITAVKPYNIELNGRS